MIMKMEKSWEKIFDLDKCIELGFATNDSQSIQATLWEIKPEWIHKVDFLQLNKQNLLIKELLKIQKLLNLFIVCVFYSRYFLVYFKNEHLLFVGFLII